MASTTPISLKIKDREIRFPRRPLVMAVVNINDDSFCGDGTLDPTEALSQARDALRSGADVIDAGAESARTNRGPISPEEEIARLLPFIRAFPALVAEFSGPPLDSEQLWPPLLSINTWRPEVVEGVLGEGGDLLNDMGGLPDSRNARLCAAHGAALLIMHTVGLPKVPHTGQQYADVCGALEDFFAEKLALASEAGLDPQATLLDPGIDFAKQRDDNLKVYRDLERIVAFNRPVLVPVSQKTVIGDVLNLPDPRERDAGTVACLTRGVVAGAQLFRVHNVPAAVQTIKTLWALEHCPAPSTAGG